MHPDRDKVTEDRIKERFPELFIMKHATPAVGNGWLFIVERMCEKIYPIIMKEPDGCVCGHVESEHPVIIEQTVTVIAEKSFRGAAIAATKPGPSESTRTLCAQYRKCKPHFQQIKQKFGSLRVYMHFTNPEIDEAIAAADDEASVTCEDCGQPGQEVSISSWIAVMCPICEKFNRAEREGWKIEVLG